MSSAKFDQVDRQILEDLQSDGRMTNVDLAKRAGISAPPCLRRVRALEQSGMIRGYHADLDEVALGYEVMFFTLVGLDSQSIDVLASFEERLSAWPEVRELHMVRGAGDFMLRLLARNTAHENELTERLVAEPHVNTVQTIQVIRTAKSEPGVPF